MDAPGLGVDLEAWPLRPDGYRRMIYETESSYNLFAVTGIQPFPGAAPDLRPGDDSVLHHPIRILCLGNGAVRLISRYPYFPEKLKSKPGIASGPGTIGGQRAPGVGQFMGPIPIDGSKLTRKWDYRAEYSI